MKVLSSIFEFFQYGKKMGNTNPYTAIFSIPLHTPLKPNKDVCRGEIPCLSVGDVVVYGIEIVEVSRATLCSFYHYRNLWSIWVSVKPHAFQRRSIYSTILQGGFYVLLN